MDDTRVHRVTVRDQFADLSEATRAYVVASQPDHDIFVSAFTEEGTFTYDDRVLFFTLRYEIRCAADVDPSRAALTEAEQFLRVMGFGYKSLRAKAMDVSAIWDDVERSRNT